MANRLLSRHEIMHQLTLLDGLLGKEGYAISDTEIVRKSDGRLVRYTTEDLMMPMHEFSRRILYPLVNQKYKPATILDERGKTHGDYVLMAATIQEIKRSMRGGPNWEIMYPGNREALELIATKIGRIVCGDPNCQDHWTDIIGYATLALQRISKG